jgi:amino acid transporter
MADAATHVFGVFGGRVVTLAVIVSCLAAVNGLLFSGARVTYAMARDGLFVDWAATVNEQKVPGNALLCQGIWASFLTLTGRYEQLFTYVVVAVWLFYMLGAFAVVILRYRYQNDSRPYEVTGYPYIPVIFGTVAWALVLQTLWSHPWDAIIGASLVLTGVPAFWYWSRRTNGDV